MHRITYNNPIFERTHPNPSLDQGGASLRSFAGAHSPSLVEGGGQGVGTLNSISNQ